MNWSDKGFLLSKLSFQENSVIANFYTKKHGKCSGVIYGATSKKIKNYLQKGNELYLEYNSKNENTLGYFKVEIINPHTSKFFSDKKKLNCIVSMLELIKILTVEGQENIKIYKLINELFKLLNNENWSVEYVFWELNLLKFILASISNILFVNFFASPDLSSSISIKALIPRAPICDPPKYCSFSDNSDANL